jgi:hypothetical protein
MTASNSNTPTPSETRTATNSGTGTGTSSITPSATSTPGSASATPAACPVGVSRSRNLASFAFLVTGGVGGADTGKAVISGVYPILTIQYANGTIDSYPGAGTQFFDASLAAQITFGNASLAYPVGGNLTYAVAQAGCPDVVDTVSLFNGVVPSSRLLSKAEESRATSSGRVPHLRGSAATPFYRAEPAASRLPRPEQSFAHLHKGRGSGKGR